MPTLRGSRARDQRKESVPTPAEPPAERRLLSGRTGLILLYALIAAAVVGGLTFAVQRNLAQAILAGLPAFGVTVTFLDRIIGSRWE